MLQARPAARALQHLPQARCFSTTAPTAALSPHKRASQTQSNTTTTKRNVSDTSKRSAQAAAAPLQKREVPSPAFNRDETRYKDVQPLQPYRQPEMDHSFVGMTGGQIFHEMMLRQDVKHVCKSDERERTLCEMGIRS